MLYKRVCVAKKKKKKKPAIRLFSLLTKKPAIRLFSLLTRFLLCSLPQCDTKQTGF